MSVTAPAPAAAVDTSGIRLRPIEPGDRPEVSRIVYEAFAGIHDHHRFPRDFPTLEAAVGLVDAFVANPSVWGVVADRDGEILGSNFLDERGPVRGVGPITVDPRSQATGVGRRLMQAVIERGAAGAGVRLLQDSFNTASLALYASLGFEVVEPVALLAGTPRAQTHSDVQVRPLVPGDLEACEQLCVSVHGFERTQELRDAIVASGLHPVAAIRDDRLVAYATTLTFFPAAYAVAESEDGLGGSHRGCVPAWRRAGFPPASDPPARAVPLVPRGRAAGRQAHDVHGPRRAPPPAGRVDPLRALLRRPRAAPSPSKTTGRCQPSDRRAVSGAAGSGRWR